jgi:glycosyltransferase involved in cell wall biosynthesis
MSLTTINDISNVIPSNTRSTRYSHRTIFSSLIFLAAAAIMLSSEVSVTVSVIMADSTMSSDSSTSTSALLATKSQAVTASHSKASPDGDSFRLSDVSIMWYAPFYSGGGYCSEAISYVTSLVRKGFSLIEVIQHGDITSKTFQAGMSDDTRNLLSTLQQNRLFPSKSIAVCHSVPAQWDTASAPAGDPEVAVCPPLTAMFRVGRTMFETDSVPSGWIPKLHQMDRIWVPTQFHVETFAKAGVHRSKLKAIPEPVDTEFYSPDRVEGMLLPERKPDQFVFLSVFKWEPRKGWNFLLDAFAREFNATENVALFILTHAPNSFQPVHLTKQVDEFVKNAREEMVDKLEDANIDYVDPGHAPVHLISSVPDDMMPALYKSADCVVIPSRGEGWGRPHVEAMSMGKPLIATNWSGPTEFLNEKNGYPLPIEKLEPAVGIPGHNWARPNTTALMQLMRRAFTNRKEAAALGAQARKDMVSKYCEECVGKILIEEMRTIVRKIMPRLKNAQFEGSSGLPSANTGSKSGSSGELSSSSSASSSASSSSAAAAAKPSMYYGMDDASPAQRLQFANRIVDTLEKSSLGSDGVAIMPQSWEDDTVVQGAITAGSDEDSGELAPTMDDIAPASAAI